MSFWSNIVATVGAAAGYPLPGDTPADVMLMEQHLITASDEVDRVATAMGTSAAALTAAWQAQTPSALAGELDVVIGELRRASTAMGDAVTAARIYRRVLEDAEEELVGIRARRATADQTRDDERRMVLTTADGTNGTAGPTPDSVDRRLTDIDADHQTALDGLLADYVAVRNRVSRAAATFGARLSDLAGSAGSTGTNTFGGWAGLWFVGPEAAYASMLSAKLASVQAVQTAALGHEPGGPGGPRFVLGSPTRPEFHWDEDFPYDPDASPGVGDYISWAKWRAKLKGVDLIRPDLDDSTALYRHYTDGSGDPREVDFEEGYREDGQIRVAVDSEVASARQWAERLARETGRTSFSMTGDAIQAGDYTRGYPTDTENWQKTLGGYQMWSSADVHVDGNQVTMTVTVHAEDRYNFNRDDADIATGAKDNENGRFAELGWARSFDVHGQVQRTVTWTLGDPAPPVIGDESDPARNPGREDREDGRGGSDGGRPVIPDNDRDTGRSRVE